MGNKPAQPKFTTGLEEYIQKTQQSFERSIAEAATPEIRKEKQLSRKISLWEVDCAEKYKLKSSALAMIARLKPERSGRIEELPGTGIWVVLDNPELSNLYFSSMGLAATSYVESRHAVLTPDWLPIAQRPWLWTLEISQLGKHPLSYAYHAERGLWTLNMGQFCSTGQCERTGKDGTGWPGWYICPTCRPAFDYWTSWFPIALMAINGDFAETEEHTEPQRITTHEHRQGQQSKKTIAHSWQVITFDISVKSPMPHPESLEQEPFHPTWLENAIANETVVYVAKHIGQTQRTFHHERYINMRGKTIDVRPYDKRVPMSVGRLKHTIHQAVARKSE